MGQGGRYLSSRSSAQVPGNSVGVTIHPTHRSRHIVAGECLVHTYAYAPAGICTPGLSVTLGRYRNAGNRSHQRTVQAPVMTTMRRLGLRARWLLSAVGLALVSASCGVRPASTDSIQPSGSTALVFGVVQASPGCPVERQDHACQSRRLGDIQVEARPLRAGVTVSTRTRTDGHYSVRLAQGRYVLVAVTKQVVPRCPHVLVSVTSTAPVRASINCDSGIR